MHAVLGNCPVCTHEMEVTRLYCRHCDTTVSGHFALNRFSQLSGDQLAFVELFVRMEGKLNRVGQELDLSYSAVRSRLTEVIEALGYAPGAPEPVKMSAEQRREVLAMVSAGEISAEEAVSLLRQ